MPEILGSRLREARLQRGLSLRSVAQALGLSASLISQVEIGKTQPSVSTLYALASYLGISLDELLGIPPAATGAAAGQQVRFGSSSPDVQRAADNPVIEMENGVRWERLAGGADGPADAMLVTYAPGASSSVEGKLMRHAGIEYAFIIEGELTLQLEFDEYVLHPGDSLQFNSVRPHLYANNGSAPAKGVWFTVGRREDNPALRDVPVTVANTAGNAAGELSSAVDVLRAMDDLRP
jgi:transcriptional regulator with XRE-family HTH domain